MSCRLGSSAIACTRAAAPVPPRSTRSPTVSVGSTVSCSSISAAGSSLPSTYARRKPANSIAFPDAVKIAGRPSVPRPVMSTVVRSTRASTICDAIVRFQISS